MRLSWAAGPDADDTDAAVTIAVTVVGKPAAEATEQEDDEDNDKPA